MIYFLIYWLCMYASYMSNPLQWPRHVFPGILNRRKRLTNTNLCMWGVLLKDTTYVPWLSIEPGPFDSKSTGPRTPHRCKYCKYKRIWCRTCNCPCNVYIQRQALKQLKVCKVFFQIGTITVHTLPGVLSYCAENLYPQDKSYVQCG